MSTIKFMRWLGAAAACLLCATGAHATDRTRATPREAQALFERAVKFLDANGPDRAFAAFDDRKGPFVYKDLYVFVIDMQGEYRANGASPETLVGLNVLETTDAAGTPLFRNMIGVVRERSEGKVHYVWLNRRTNKVEPKVTFLHRSGDYVLGVGYYVPRSTPAQARRLLDAAAALVRSRGMDAAAAAFNDKQGPYMHDDLYVFAVNLDSGRFEAMGAVPGLTGSDARDLRDAEGHALIRDMIDLARRDGAGSVDYVWRNPVTNAVERKRSFIRREGTSLIGVGYYME